VPAADPNDAALARELHARGVVPAAALRDALAEAARRRAAGAGARLGDVLRERGVTAGALAEAVRTVAARVRSHETTPPVQPRLLETRGPSGTQVDPARRSAAVAAPGPRRLGPYRLERELARGGMGAVNEAVNEATGARVALKLLLPAGLAEGADGPGVARFRREAELNARLDHRHVVRVHATGVWSEWGLVRDGGRIEVTAHPGVPELRIAPARKRLPDIRVDRLLLDAEATLADGRLRASRLEARIEGDLGVGDERDLDTRTTRQSLVQTGP